MTPSGDLDSLQDAISILDRAVEANLSLTFETRGQAVNFRQRLYTARKRDRAIARSSHDPSDPLYGKSVYDRLSVSDPQMEDGFWTIKVFTPKVPRGLLKVEEEEPDDKSSKNTTE